MKREKNQSNGRITLALTPEDVKIIQAYAVVANQTVSAIVSNLIRTHIPKWRDEVAKWFNTH